MSLKIEFCFAVKALRYLDDGNVGEKNFVPKQEVFVTTIFFDFQSNEWKKKPMLRISQLPTVEVLLFNRG